MSHEKVSVYLGGLDPKSPYFPYIRQRNGAIAKHISRYLGKGFDETPYLEPPAEKRYIVPGRTIDTVQAQLLQIESAQEFYGAVAPDFGMIGKTILHPSASEAVPPFYSHTFSQAVVENGLVLPGITAFLKQDALDGYRKLPHGCYRLKAPNESDGNGQYVIHDAAHLLYMLNRQIDEDLKNTGLVIEPNLDGDRKTVSAGVFQIGTDCFAFAASQQNDIAEDGRDRYLGAKNVTVVRGNLARLTDALRHDGRLEVVRKAALFHDLFAHYYPVTASRLSYDVLEGVSGGKFLSGVTDITARLGGTCPALILAAQYLQEQPSAETVIGEVNLNYHPDKIVPEEKSAVVFLNASSLRITARIDRVL